VDAAIAGAHIIRAGIGLVPIDHDRRIPGRAADFDLAKIEVNVRQEPVEPLIPAPGGGERVARAAQRMLAEKRMLKGGRECREHRLGIAFVDGGEQRPDAAANYGVIHRFTFCLALYARSMIQLGLDLIGDWWSPLIVRDLYLGVVRFDDLVEDLGISRNLLTRRLNALSKNGIVERHAYRRRPFRYEYRLSEAGRDLVPAILALTAWGDRWACPREGSPMLFVHKTCGQRFEPHVTARSAARRSPPTPCSPSAGRAAR
jgi:DNA-binding HxlR family transcriptional regulator